MMLEHLAEHRQDPRCKEVAQRVSAAYTKALADDQKTKDLGGSLGTKQFTQAVIDRLGA